MKLASKSLSTRISLNVLFIVSVLFIISIAVVAVSSHKLIADEANKSAQHLLDATSAELEKTLKEVEFTTNSMSWLVREHLDDSAYLCRIISQMTKENATIIGSAVALRPGYLKDRQHYMLYGYRDADHDTCFINQLAGTGYDYAGMEWYTSAARSLTPTWSEPYFDAGGGNCMMSTYSVPLLDGNGQLAAIFTADISLEWTSRMVAAIKPYPHSQATLVSRKGAYIGSEKIAYLSGQDLLTTSRATGNKAIVSVAEAMLRGDSGTMHFRHNGITSFCVFTPLENGWSLSVMSEYRDVLRRTSQMNMVLIFVGLMGLLVLFILLYRTIRHLTQPITDLSVSAMNMAKGNFNTKLVEVNTNDEMRMLRDSFAYMQQTINQYISELRTTTASQQRLESELNVARGIQEGMLPKNFPDNLYAMLSPAKEVGGDLYDFSVLNGKIYFTMGDVSGKGVPAALIMAMTRAAFSFLSSMNYTMTQIVSIMNKSLSEGNDRNMFCTLFAGCYDTGTHELHFCNAGHNPIIVLPPQGAPYYLKAKSNLALGLISDFPYQGESLTLQPGTRLLLYTDGVTEAETAGKELFGEDRLLSEAARLTRTAATPHEMVEGIYEAVREFVAGNAQNDDITILSVSL
ncbi:MAG: sigma-B regulation protein RsbU (phosphoserine phosphatase) [bacterium P3]|nr:MAG: sigma-B regulation protein RsbU (phosphoserine phosphatase) [bacterium P3]KWW42160.1 MAG: sigma-B regulation protein RsbU (phosphoserine phosphatase) [bacterium F083]